MICHFNVCLTFDSMLIIHSQAHGFRVTSTCGHGDGARNFSVSSTSKFIKICRSYTSLLTMERANHYFYYYVH